MWVSIKDKDLYAIVGQEVANGVIDTGLWTKAIANSGGSDAQAKSLYLKMRVLDLSNQRDAQQRQLQQQRIEQDKQQEEERKTAEYWKKQQEEEREAAELEAQPWWKKLFRFVLSAIFFLIFLYIFLKLRRSFGFPPLFCC